MPAYSYSKLKGKIKELYGKQGTFAMHIKMSPNYVSGKLTGKSMFTQKDIVMWAYALEINRSEYADYFFC